MNFLCTALIQELSSLTKLCTSYDRIIDYKKLLVIYKFMNRKDVDPSHYNQATAYSLALGIDEVLFVYISRDILDMKAFMFNVTGDMKAELIGYIEECDGYVSRMIAPPKPENVTKKSCNYCGYKTQCKKDG